MSRGKVPPHNLDAEESLLGAALLRQQIVGDLADRVDPSDFYKPVHQQVWASMLDLHAEGVGIDAITVRDRVPDATMELLLGLQNATPSLSNASRYAEFVVEASRARKLLAHFTVLADRCYTDTPDDVLADIDPSADQLVGRRGDTIDGLSRLDVFTAAARTARSDDPWLIPHITRPRWRTILVAGEGQGKAVVMRYLGLHAAAGRDPWNPTHFIDPVRTLYIDVENPNTTILHQIEIANPPIDLEAEAAENYFIWHREGGMNLRERRTQAELERVLQETRPQLVFAGPLYKMYRRGGGEDMEQATIEFLRVLDDFRVRYNFAIFLEHHAPKGSGGFREMNPFGSSALLRWPEFGITLETEGDPAPDETKIALKVGRFRRDREPADWPTQLFRGQLGQREAWAARWAAGRNRRGWTY